MSINSYNVSFIHINKTPNTGDLNCSPYRYFYFPNVKIFDINSSNINSHAIIYGGGAIESRIRDENFFIGKNANFNIGWGIGYSRSGRKHPGDTYIPSNFILYGRREFGRLGGEYVPCVSCMSEYFNLDYKIEHEIGIYSHAVKSKFDLVDTGSIPKINNRQDFKESIAFLGSVETVITDSFHGIYWSILLGKKVLAIPFSSKFYGFKYPPTYSTYSECLSQAKQCVSYSDEPLKDSRYINIKFYEKVMNIIS